MNDRHVDVLFRRLLAGHPPTAADRAHASTCDRCRSAIRDAERLDERLHAAARPLASEPLPEGTLSPSTGTTWTWARLGVPAAVAVVLVGIAAGLTLSSLPPAGIASPSPEPSYAAGTPLPEETGVPSPEPVTPGDLVAGPNPCADGTVGFSVWIPAGWYANAAHDGIPACRLVSTEPFVLTDLQDSPSVAIRVAVEAGEFGTTDEVLERTELTLAELPALRLVIRADEGRRLAYVVGLDGALPSEGSPGRYLFATTNYGDSTFERDSVALDEMLSRFIPWEPFADNPEASAAADALFEDTKTCSNPAGPFEILYPAAWFTNPVTADAPACTFFGPAEIVPGEPDQPPTGAVIGLRIFPGSVATFEPTFAYETLNVGGRPAERTERHAGTIEAPDYSRRTYQYVVQFGEDLSLIAGTNDGMAADYDLAKEVLDRMMASLRLVAE